MATIKASGENRTSIQYIQAHAFPYSQAIYTVQYLLYQQQLERTIFMALDTQTHICIVRMVKRMNELMNE